jgi:release factor glutamine methyltransferase
MDMDLAAVLAGHGFVAPEEEAAELLDAAAGDAALLDELVARRLGGEPLAWITGRVTFCGVDVRVGRGVYVPRWHSERLAWRAVERLAEHGTAVDVCTGSGAIAKVLMAQRPRARVLATDVDERAVACARSNGVDARRSDLLEAVTDELDLVVSVPPFVPTPELSLLQRDTFAFETPLAYDGGPDGTAILRRVLAGARRRLVRGGAVILGLGAGQPEALAPELERLGYVDVAVIRDEDGDVRGLEATLR